MTDSISKQAAKAPEYTTNATPSNNPNTRSREIPISLGKPSLKRRLEDYYTLVYPDSIQDPVKWRSTLDQIYDKYGGTFRGERKLSLRLAKKYGNTVQLLLAESVVDKTKQKESPTGTQASPGNAKNGNLAGAANRNNPHDEPWFELRPEEKDSGIVDFTSDRFDPVAALRRPEALVVLANPWIPTCPQLNHSGQFQSLLPLNDPLYRDVVTAGPAKAVANNDDKPKKKTLGPFATLAEPHTKGPLSMLRRLFEQRQRIRVLVRYVNGIRGTVTGYLIAFDKHMNMILRDVDEVYCPRPTANAINNNDSEEKEDFLNSKNNRRSNLEVELDRRTQALQQHPQQQASKTTTSRSNDIIPSTWSIRQRHLKQILVRGDNVVMVYKAEAERSAWPRTGKSPTCSIYKTKAMTVPPERRVGTPGSLIYALQQQERRKTQQLLPHRRRSGDGQRHDYQSSKR